MRGSSNVTGRIGASDSIRDSLVAFGRFVGLLEGLEVPT